MTNHKWYVLQVKTGYECSVSDELNKRGFPAVVPIENRMIHRKGGWIQRPYVVFTGYVFIYIDYDWSKYYAMSGISGIIKILGGGQSPTPLSHNEVIFINRLSELLGEPSIIEFSENGDYKCLNGFLAEFEKDIIKVERRYKRATVQVTVAGESIKIKVSFVEPEQTPKQTED